MIKPKHMAAPVLSISDYRTTTRMKIPLQSEVAAFMREKTGWPIAFCQEYADKFWHYYNAQGWKLSNNVPMKSWHSAFLRNWKDLKDESLKKRLLELTKSSDTPEDYLNRCLALHAKMLYKPSKEELLGIYDFLKKSMKLNLSKEQIDEIVEQGGNSKERCRMLAIRKIFDHMVTYNLKF